MQHQPTYLPEQSILIRVTGICWLLAKWLSYKVWIKDRLFPTYPVADFLDVLPNSLHVSLYAISLVALIGLIALPTQRTSLIVLLGTEIGACLLDQNRLQPWEYQYVCTIALLLFCNNKPGELRKLLLMIVISTYVFSGLHKLNNGFLHRVWDRMFLESFLKFPSSIIYNDIIFNAGYALGIIEAGAGLLLMYKKMRRKAAIVLICMHVFNLLLLGPTGLNKNSVIWPWNLAMIGWLYCLFLKRPIDQQPSIVMINFFGRVMLWLWLIFPAFSLFGLWDHYLSSDLYSGKLPYLAICVPVRLPDTLQQFTARKPLPGLCRNGQFMYVQTWGMAEMNVVPYPSERTNRQFKEKFLTQFSSSNPSFYMVQIRDSTIVTALP